MRSVYLNFHGIGVPQRPLEPGEAPYWVSEAFYHETLKLADRLKDQVDTRVTFDDGNLSDLEIGAEGLARFGLRGEFFVLSARLGETGSLAPEDLNRLQAQGHMIGLHGAQHRDWTALDGAGLSEELDTARDILQKAINRPILAAAIPFGRYNRAVLSGLRQRGYTRVYSSDGGAARDTDMPIPRTSPRADMDLTEIENILLGREGRKRQLRRRLARAIKRWV